MFCEPKGFGKGEQGHLEETQRFFEHNVSTVDGQGQNLGSIDDLVGHNVLCVKRIQDEERIEFLGIVGQDGEFEIIINFLNQSRKASMQVVPSK